MIVKKTDVVSAIYLLLIVFLSINGVKLSFIILCIYIMISLMLINDIEHFLAICSVTATMAYYFVGADEGIYSIYSIFMVIFVIKSLLSQKIVFDWTGNFLPKLLIIILAFISYKLSPFQYGKGFFLFVYIVLFSILIGSLLEINYKEYFRALTFLACLMVYCYVIMVFATGVTIEGRVRLAEDINANTCGMSCSQLGIIIFLSWFTQDASSSLKGLKLITFCVDLVILFLTGSRTALMAMVLAVVMVIFVSSIHRERLRKRLNK